MKITVIDYGLSNLLSVRRAIEKLGHSAHISGEKEDVMAATALLLPGVGAFADGMRGLANLGLVEAIRQKATQGTPLLGICLGMQMLFDESEEFGVHRGLGLIPGCVVHIPHSNSKGERQPVPHVGWSGLLPPAGQVGFASPLLREVQPGTEVYFVHSYEAKPQNVAHSLAETLYGGRRVCAMAGHKNVVGTQFHPEKSGEDGLAILDSFIQLCEKA